MMTLTRQEISEKYPVIYKVFFQLNTRREKETLHDYFIRRQLKCFCRNCVDHRRPRVTEMEVII